MTIDRTDAGRAAAMARAAAVPVGTDGLSGAAARSTSDRPLAAPVRLPVPVAPVPVGGGSGSRIGPADPGSQSPGAGTGPTPWTTGNPGGGATESARTRPVASTVAQTGAALGDVGWATTATGVRWVTWISTVSGQDRLTLAPAEVDHAVEAGGQGGGVDVDERPRWASPATASTSARETDPTRVIRTWRSDSQGE